jgi:hypothetical protein
LPPIDSAEFDAHKDLTSIVTDFLCRNRDKGFSAKEISLAVGISEADVNHVMLKIGLADLVGDLTRGVITKKKNTRLPLLQFKIEDVTINHITYYRCIEQIKNT